MSINFSILKCRLENTNPYDYFGLCKSFRFIKSKNMIISPTLMLLLADRHYGQYFTERVNRLREYALDQEIHLSPSPFFYYYQGRVVIFLSALFCIIPDKYTGRCLVLLFFCPFYQKVHICQ